MIKNPQILEAFEKREAQKESNVSWYTRAEQLYQMGLKLNAEAIKNGGQEHLKMLIQVRKKMKLWKKNHHSA